VKALTCLVFLGLLLASRFLLAGQIVCRFGGALDPEVNNFGECRSSGGLTLAKTVTVWPLERRGELHVRTAVTLAPAYRQGLSYYSARQSWPAPTAANSRFRDRSQRDRMSGPRRDERWWRRRAVGPSHGPLQALGPVPYYVFCVSVCAGPKPTA
jgi:hypothetical protein